LAGCWCGAGGENDVLWLVLLTNTLKCADLCVDWLYPVGFLKIGLAGCWCGAVGEKCLFLKPKNVFQFFLLVGDFVSRAEKSYLLKNTNEGWRLGFGFFCFFTP
jgi:hypothetical protein